MIDVTIDVSQVSYAVSGLSGMIDSMDGNGEYITRPVTRNIEREFGRAADIAGSKGGPLDHLYEYGMEGAPQGRLWGFDWKSTGSSATAKFFFIDSKTTAPVDPRILADASAKSIPIARHVFRDKAFVLETSPNLESQVGVNRHTIRQGGVANPQMLVFWSDSKNRPMFVRAMERENKKFNNFSSFIESYFRVGAIENEVEVQMRSVDREVGAVHGNLQSEVSSVGHMANVMAGQGTRVVNMGVDGGVTIIKSVRKKYKAMLDARLKRRR